MAINKQTPPDIRAWRRSPARGLTGISHARYSRALRGATQRGFSLVELLISVSIILIVSGIAVPAVLSYLQRYRVEASARNVAALLLRARTEAVNAHQRVSTIFVAPTGVNGAVYGIDLNGDGTLEATEPQTMLSSGVSFWQNNSPSVPVETNLPSDYTSLAAPTSFAVTFSPQGTVVVQNGGTWQLASNVFALCLTNGSSIGAAKSESWLVAITPAAHVRVFHWQSGTGWVLF